jgi:hypothetical protein
LSFSFSDYHSHHHHSHWPSTWWFSYDDCYDPFVSYRSYWYHRYDDCWDDYRWYYYRPVYGCYRPRYHIYRPLYSTVYYSDYSYLEPDYVTTGYETPYDYLAGGSTSTNLPQLSAADDAWEYLASGDAREARRLFDRAVNAYPADGLPQIGYALSAALLDRHAEAAVYMRRALRDDPESLREIPLSEDLRTQIQPLLETYLHQSKQNVSDIDSLFMLAVLHTIDGDEAMAYFAIDRAAELGDGDRAVANLKSMLQQSLDRAPSQPAPTPVPVPQLQSAPEVQGPAPSTAPASEVLY